MKVIFNNGTAGECAPEEELHIIRHSAAHIMAQAIKRLFPDAMFAYGPATENGFYYDVDLGDRKLGDEDLAAIEAEMKKIVKENLPIKPFTLPREEAVAFMTERGEKYKVEHIGDLPEDEQFPEEEPLSEDEQLPKPQLQHETVKEELVPEEEDDDIPGFFDEPEIITVAAKASAAAKPTINDAHSTDQAWRKDMPGTPVKDIRSAISLNDRVFYINNLFNEDAQAFVNTLSSINSMASLDEVVDFVTDQFPHWNLNSDVVYRFMMAVRRKVK